MQAGLSIRPAACCPLAEPFLCGTERIRTRPRRCRPRPGNRLTRAHDGTSPSPPERRPAPPHGATTQRATADRQM